MTQETQPPRELYAAMAKAFDRLRYMQKSGSGSNTGISVDTVKRDIGRAFQQVGLILLPNEVENRTEPHVNKDGGRAGYLTTVIVDFRVVHVETGQSVVQRVSGQGYDSTDKGGLKAWSQAIKAWGINTNLIEAGFDPETDDDDEQINKDAIEASFKRLKQALNKVAPTREEADKTYAETIGYYKTHSNRPVEDPREFRSRADAKHAYAALEQVERIWAEQRFEREAIKVTPKQKSGKAAAGDLGLSDADLDGMFAKQERV